jgi:hypothetical protein
VARLGSSGASDLGFGQGGLFRNDALASYALDGRGGYVASAESSGRPGRHDVKLIRLTSHGRIDRRFGSARISVSGPKSSLGLLATWKGESVIAGTRVDFAKHGRPVQKWFGLSRVTAAGKLDRTVGRDGLLTTRFGRPSFAFGKALILDSRGRPVIAGVYRGGLALARYSIDR